MKLSYDLHIHSCLSPCGDMDMTPANIVGMAAVKGLDVIAVTDHNACGNCAAAMALGEAYDVLVIPGMELNTQEEVHVVCLFPTLEQALDFEKYVYEKLQKIPNNPEIFGRQVFMNEDDEETGEEEFLLINATDIGFDQVYEVVRGFGGMMIPAHVDKSANSLLGNLGFIPPDSRFVCAEVKDLKKLPGLQQQHAYLENCNIITDSDAHYLEYIEEPIHFLEVEERSIEAVLRALGMPCGKVFVE